MRKMVMMMTLMKMFRGISGLCDEHFDKGCDVVHDGEDDSNNDGGDDDDDDVDERADQVRGIGGLRAGRQVHGQLRGAAQHQCRVGARQCPVDNINILGCFFDSWKSDSFIVMLCFNFAPPDIFYTILNILLAQNKGKMNIEEVHQLIPMTSLSCQENKNALFYKSYKMSKL